MKRNNAAGYNMTPAQVGDLFDRVRRNDHERAKAVFLTHCTAGNWFVEIATTPAAWHTLEFRVAVIDPASIKVDERRCHTFRVYTQVEAFIRLLRRDEGGIPKPLGDLTLKRLDARNRPSNRTPTRANKTANRRARS